MRETKRIKEWWTIRAQSLVNERDDRCREDRFVDEPESIQEIIHPICGLVLGRQPGLDELALNVVARALTYTSHGGGVIGGARSQKNEEPPPAEVEESHKMRCEHSLVRSRKDHQLDRRKYAGETYEYDDCSIVVPFTVILLRDPGIHETQLLPVLILRRLIEIGERPPANLVPVGNPGSLMGGEGAWRRLRGIFGRFLVYILYGDGRE